jgi:hypothetical protein
MGKCPLMQIHFRQQHFLCEDEACLAKKFIVFQSESEMKVTNYFRMGSFPISSSFLLLVYLQGVLCAVHLHA